jgi:hypothetical protein
MSEMTDSKAVEALQRAVNRACLTILDNQEAKDSYLNLVADGYQILPTATDERLREAVADIKHYAMASETYQDEIKAEYEAGLSTIEAALAELAELRAAGREYLDAIQAFANDGEPANSDLTMRRLL